MEDAHVPFFHRAVRLVLRLLIYQNKYILFPPQVLRYVRAADYYKTARWRALDHTQTVRSAPRWNVARRAFVVVPGPVAEGETTGTVVMREL